MSSKKLLKLGLLGTFIFLVVNSFLGCGYKQWSPTDPMLNEPDTSQIHIVEHLEITINSDVE